jgi:proline dehydrogenase
MLDFNNTEIAFASKSNNDLRNAYILFKAMSSSVVVKAGKGVTEFATGIGFPLSWAVKPTLYRQFVGGETLQEASKTVGRLMGENIYSVLDYSSEGGKELSDVERTYNEILRSIDNGGGNEAIAFTVFKPTGLIVGSVLEIASLDEDGLNDIERAELENFKNRFMALCRRAAEKGVRILVDAEHYYCQNLFDKLTEEAMATFNKARVIVFHTLQMYRHDRLDYLRRIHKDAQDGGYKLGIKFVRGAYMEEERERAVMMGYISPICATKAETDLNYDNGLRYVMDNIDEIELFSGTHNYESNYLLAELVNNKGISKDDKRVWFSQLYGMSDNITYALAREGYNVCKYIPYAPVKEVLPYLLRRAEENTSMAGQTGRELGLIKDEMNRRGIRLV